MARDTYRDFNSNGRFEPSGGHCIATQPRLPQRQNHARSTDSQERVLAHSMYSNDTARLIMKDPASSSVPGQRKAKISAGRARYSGTTPSGLLGGSKNLFPLTA